MYLVLVDPTDRSQVTKVEKYYVILFTLYKARWARWKKNGIKIMQLKWPKYQKPKDENMGSMKHY